MNVLNIHCPDCGAHLETSESTEVFYCQYCGHKFVLDEQVKANIRMREKEREYRHREKMQGERLGHEVYMQGERIEHEETMFDKDFEREKWQAEREDRNERIGMIASVIAVLFVIGIGMLIIIGAQWLMHNR